MHIRSRGRNGRSEPRLKMTAMIDIVFLLLVFFVMTFTIVSPEGDFGIDMPLAAAGEPPVPVHVPLHLRLTATPQGDLATIRLNEVGLDSFDELQGRLITLIDNQGPELADRIEIDVDSDYQLQYRHVMAALSAANGYVTDDGRVVSLVEKIHLTARREPKR